MKEKTYTPSNTIKSLSLCITLFLHPPLNSGIRYTQRTNSVKIDTNSAHRNLWSFGLARRAAVAGLRRSLLRRTRRKYSAQKKAKTRRETTWRQIPASMMLVPDFWAASVLADAAMPPPVPVEGVISCFFLARYWGLVGGRVVWRGLTLEDEGEEVGGYENDGVINGF